MSSTLRAGLSTFVISVALAGLSGPSCVAGKGAIMLAVSTDMKAPKDVNLVSLTVSTGPAVKYNFLGRVTPDGEVKLPATLAIVEPDDPKASVRVRVIAFQESHPRVLRDIRTTVPRARVALLRLPLNFVNDGSATGELPAKFLPPKGGGGGQTSAEEFNAYDGTVGSQCGPSDEQTSVDGECKDSTIDSTTLPDYREDLVFGSQGRCFDARQCLASATPVSTGGTPKVVDCGGMQTDTNSDSNNCGQCGFMCNKQVTPYCVGGMCQATPGADTGDLDVTSCTLRKGNRDASKLNLALATSTVGECVQPGLCLVPLDKDDGWTDDSSAIRLSPGVCRKLKAGARLFESSSCAPKQASTPVCSGAIDAGASDGGIIGGDGGMGGDGGAMFDSGGTCQQPLQQILTLQGPKCAYVRGDGATLLAHYGPGVRALAYNSTVTQMMDTNGGGSVPPSWAPDEDTQSGHLAFNAFNPAGKLIILECGMTKQSKATYQSSTLFTSFAPGQKGNYGLTGSPGWGFFGAGVLGGAIRSSHAACGMSLTVVPANDPNSSGQIAYCSGPGAASSFANHLVSYHTGDASHPDSPYVGCNGTGCNGPSCQLQVWVWLK